MSRLNISISSPLCRRHTLQIVFWFSLLFLIVVRRLAPNRCRRPILSSPTLSPYSFFFGIFPFYGEKLLFQREPVITIFTASFTTDNMDDTPRWRPSSSSGHSTDERPPPHDGTIFSSRGRNLRRRAQPLPDTPTFPGSPPIVLPPSSCHAAKHVAGKRVRVAPLSLVSVKCGGVRFERPRKQRCSLFHTEEEGGCTLSDASPTAIEEDLPQCHRDVEISVDDK